MSRFILSELTLLFGLLKAFQTLNIDFLFYFHSHFFLSTMLVIFRGTGIHY